MQIGNNPSKGDQWVRFHRVALRLPT